MPSDLSPENFPALWRDLIDDAAVFPPGNAAIPAALDSYAQRTGEWFAPLVGSLVLRDTDLGSAPPNTPISVVATTGAGAIEGITALAARRGLTVAAIETALRDLDDLAGNVRRIDAAVRGAELGEDVPIFIEIPGPATPAWLAAADEVAASAHLLKFRMGNVDHDLIPSAGTVAAWIDAALDRETPFKATAGLHRAVRHEPEGGGAHGFLNVLVATRALWDGASQEEAVAILHDTDGAALARHDLGQIRRWFTSFGSCSITEPLDDLLALDLLEEPR